jgi:hypothetical protein
MLPQGRCEEFVVAGLKRIQLPIDGPGGKSGDAGTYEGWLRRLLGRALDHLAHRILNKSAHQHRITKR